MALHYIKLALNYFSSLTNSRFQQMATLRPRLSRLELEVHRITISGYRLNLLTQHLTIL
ncbi:hypothetical protein XGA_1439 [Xanthomonas hortorum ATCC 19865]|nr:hypothetical protein XGA_1439 [Xanthomonas hortorum ATCC 19865]